jgi:hypothetical protein
MPFYKGHKFIKGGEKGWFKKGQKVRLGAKLSKKTKKQIGKSNKGNPAHRYWKGKKRPDMIGHKWNIGRKQSKITCEKKSKLKRKLVKSGNWKNQYGGYKGRTELLELIRKSLKNRQWRSDIFTRDNFICHDCGKNHCWIEAHHIKEFIKIIRENIKTFEEAMDCEELWNLNNGRTLCRECHNKTKHFSNNIKQKIQ